MATLVAHTSVASSGGALSVTTSAINCTGANFIVMAVSYYDGNAQTVSDSSSNSWTALNMYGGSPGAFQNDIQLFYVYGPTVTSSQTFTTNNASNSSYQGLAVAAFSGILSSPFDQQNGAYPASAPFQPGSITPGQNGELIIAAISDGTTTSYTIDSGMTVIETQLYSGGNNYAVGLAWKNQTTAAPIDPSWSSPGNAANTIASFKSVVAALDGWANQIYQPLTTSFPQIITV